MKKLLWILSVILALTVLAFCLLRFIPNTPSSFPGQAAPVFFQEKFGLVQGSPPRIDPTKPMIALTFDDGPSRHTERILDLLEVYHVRATFCVVGNRVNASQSTVLRAYNLGCDIIGHSWNHRDLTKLSEEQIRSQILHTEDAIRRAIGAEPLKMFRPPYGVTNQRVIGISQDLGYSIIRWSIDPLDWRTRDADETYSRVINRACDRAIVLCHDLYGATVDAMERLIPELIAEGYQLVTVSELMHYSGITPEAGRIYISG